MKLNRKIRKFVLQQNQKLSKNQKKRSKKLIFKNKQQQQLDKFNLYYAIKLIGKNLFL